MAGANYWSGEGGFYGDAGAAGVRRFPFLAAAQKEAVQMCRCGIHLKPAWMAQAEQMAAAFRNYGLGAQK
jgi:hypothetical protein